MLPWIRFLFLLALTLPGGAARAAPGASFTGVGDLPGGTTASRAYGVSGDGSTVVGQSHSDVGWEGFVWRSGVMTNLGERRLRFVARPGGGPLLALGLGHDTGRERHRRRGHGRGARQRGLPLG